MISAVVRPSRSIPTTLQIFSSPGLIGRLDGCGARRGDKRSAASSGSAVAAAAATNVVDDSLAPCACGRGDCGCGGGGGRGLPGRLNGFVGAVPTGGGPITGGTVCGGLASRLSLSALMAPPALFAEK